MKGERTQEEKDFQRWMDHSVGNAIISLALLVVATLNTMLALWLQWWQKNGFYSRTGDGADGRQVWCYYTPD